MMNSAVNAIRRYFISMVLPRGTGPPTFVAGSFVVPRSIQGDDAEFKGATLSLRQSSLIFVKPTGGTKCRSWNTRSQRQGAHLSPLLDSPPLDQAHGRPPQRIPDGILDLAPPNAFSALNWRSRQTHSLSPDGRPSTARGMVGAGGNATSSNLTESVGNFGPVDVPQLCL
jgi:hypothetical protein